MGKKSGNKKSKKRNLKHLMGNSNSDVAKTALAKIRIIEHSALNGLSYCLEDRQTVNNNELINPFLMHNFIFALSDRRSEMACNILTTNVERLFNRYGFDSQKMKNLFAKGNSEELKIEIYKIIERKLEGSFERLNKDWMLLCYLFSYFYEEKKEDFRGTAWFETMSFKLLDFVFAMELERKIVQEKAIANPNFEDITELMHDSWQTSMQDYKLLPQALICPIWSEETKIEFTMLYNNFISNFISKDAEVFAKRSTIESVFEGVNEDIVVKWKPFFEMCIKGYIHKEDISNEFGEFATKIADKFGVNGYALFSRMCGKSDAYFSKCFETFVNGIYTILVEKYMKEIVEEKDTNYKKSQEEVKTLKNSNRTFMKDIKNYEKDMATLTSKSEKLEKEVEELRQSVCNNDDYIKTQEELKKVKAALETEKENIKKVEQKSSWKDGRINELTEELKKYNNLETDLMTLQNENNAILSQIASIEALEEENETTIDDKLEHIKNEPILFVGGTGNMLMKFKEIFPNSDYIDISDCGSNFDVPSRFNYVVIYTRVVTHSHCKRIESQVDREKILLINICNKDLVIDELYKRIIGHK